MHAKRRKSMKDPLAVLERPSKRIKGLRGEVDIEELTELVRDEYTREVQHDRAIPAQRKLAGTTRATVAPRSFVVQGGSTCSPVPIFHHCPPDAPLPPLGRYPCLPLILPPQVPSLKKQVAHERSERAKRERDLDLEMQNVQVRAHSHSAGGSAHKAKSAVEGLSAGGGGLSALMATAAEVGASSSSAAGAASAGIAGRKRPRPKAETLKRAISGARGDASREGDIVFSDNDDEEDKEAAANDGDAAGATGSAANGPKPPKRARTAAGRTKAGVGKGSRFGVNDTRPGSGAELQPLFGAGAAGAGAAASEFADL